MAYPYFTQEIATGLEEDARMGRVANFAARRDALEAITGQRFAMRRTWRHGQTSHAKAVRDDRTDLARRWKDWLRSNLQAGNG